MPRQSQPVTVVIFLLLVVSTSTGDDNHDFRVWTDSTGKHKIEAALVKISGEQVHLKRKDNGKVITIAKSRLSADDKNYLSKTAVESQKSDARGTGAKGSESPPLSWTGTWNNRKYGTSGSLRCSAVVKDENTWTAKFDGNGVYGKFSYDVTIATKKNGKQIQLQGNSTVSGHRYKWTGYVKNGILFGKYTASNGNNGTFRLKEVTKK